MKDRHSTDKIFCSLTKDLRELPQVGGDCPRACDFILPWEQYLASVQEKR